MPSANSRVAEHERAVYPAALDGFLDMDRQVGNRGGAAGQLVERLSQVFGQSRGLAFKVPNNSMNVGIRQLQNLVQPVHQLDVRIATHFAKNGCALDGLIAKVIEFAEQSGSTDIAHDFASAEVKDFLTGWRPR